MSVDRINSSGPLVSAGKTRRTQGTGASGFSSMISQHDTVENQGVTGTAPASSLDALLALQQIDGDRPGRKQARQRGDHLLRGLEKLRDDLLIGQISPTTLQQMQNLLGQHISGWTDPNLQEVIAEIELRVAVELAKWARLQR